MKVFSFELSQRLQSLGCKSQSKKWYSWKSWKENPEWSMTLDGFEDKNYSTCPAFCTWDFCDNEPYAIENVRLLNKTNTVTEQRFIRDAMIYGDDPEKFIQSHLEVTPK